MAWEYNEEQKAEIAELSGIEVKDIDWSKPMLGNEEDLKEMSEAIGVSVDDMTQAFQDMKTSMSQEDFDRMWEGQRLSREIIVCFYCVDSSSPFAIFKG